MIPTSIDGTDITGATIDGTDVTEITVDGDTVFTAGPPPKPSLVSNAFEEYDFDTYTNSDGTSISTLEGGLNNRDMVGGSATYHKSGPNNQAFIDSITNIFDYDNVSQISEPIQSFAVAKTPNISPRQVITRKREFSAGFGYGVDSSQFFVTDGLATGGSADTDYHVYTHVQSSSGQNLRIDGVSTISNSQGRGAHRGYVLGGNPNGTDLWLGEIAYFAVFDQPLSISDRATFEQYLDARYL